jgi:hypothetical protein
MCCLIAYYLPNRMIWIPDPPEDRVNDSRMFYMKLVFDFASTCHIPVQSRSSMDFIR